MSRELSSIMMKLDCFINVVSGKFMFSYLIIFLNLSVSVFFIIFSKTYAYMSEQCHGRKYSKERMTVMVGANMDGTEKNKLLVI
jgi:hypothetical protein